ncbi:MAG: cell division protein FtsQ/DivIB [Gemmatimonadaceae bacterium]
MIQDDKPPGPPTLAPRSRSRRRWIKPALVAAGVLAVLLIPLWSPLLLRRLSFFRVRRVEVVGVRYVEPQEILDRLRIDTLASVWDDPDPLAARVAGHALVRHVEIDRRLPGTLVVRIVEHAPVALIPTPNGFRAYDERGVALPIDPTTTDVNAPVMARVDTVLLRLLGDARIESPALYARLSEVRREPAPDGRPPAVRAAGGDVVFVLDSMPVRASADITLQRLADVELVEQDLARRRLRAIELDLRYRDQVIARLP